MFYVYIITNKSHGTLYIGQTDNLAKRIFEHKEKHRSGFASRYNLTRLVWYEAFPTRTEAFTRERRIKNWKRAWKIELIEKTNPSWTDLSKELSFI